jgi:hypothetical protein
LLAVSAQTDAEIFENLSHPGYEHLLVGENGEIDLKGVRLIQITALPGGFYPLVHFDR